MGVVARGRLDCAVFFRGLAAGIMGHPACGARPPFPVLHDSFGGMGEVRIILIALASGALFGLIALLLIESLRATERVVRRFEAWPYLVAATGGAVLVALYLIAGDRYAGLGPAPTPACPPGPPP